MKKKSSSSQFVSLEKALDGVPSLRGKQMTWLSSEQFTSLGDTV